jgi:hypothetical protein
MDHRLSCDDNIAMYHLSKTNQIRVTAGIGSYKQNPQRLHHFALLGNSIPQASNTLNSVRRHICGKSRVFNNLQPTTRWHGDWY